MAGGPPPPEQVEDTLAWVTSVFRDYYVARPPPLPSRFARREFGFIWNGRKGFARHMGFAHRESFERYLQREGPHHSYYSTAYYERPFASTMDAKGWLGADLIFDLDADHLPDADKLSFEEQLVAVKHQAQRLLDEFLLGDLGFDPAHVRIVFSGGRGYHFHVRDPRVLKLDSPQRREIVDYVSPNDIVSEALYGEWALERTLRHEFGRPVKERLAPPADTPGWPGRITRAVADFLDETAAMPEGEAIARVSALPGLGPKRAAKLVAQLDPVRIQRIRDTGHLDQFPAMSNQSVIQALLAHAKVVTPGETDEPVTSDIKRLIRLPGSLHGKTGLRVTPLSRDEFLRFDPLRDAVAIGDEPTRVILSRPLSVRLKDRLWELQPGPVELPLHVALFAVLRRAALRPLIG